LPVIVPPPANLAVANPGVTAAQGASVQLTWNPVPGAVRYHVFRQTNTPLIQIFPPSGVVFNLGLLSITVPQDILNNKYPWLTGSTGLCPPDFNSTNPLCAAIYVVEEAALPGSTIGFPTTVQEVGVTTNTMYQETAPTSLQSIYFVKAEDAMGNRSDPSNVVGAPAPMAPPAGGTPSVAVF
jgi:hypothetical protein